MQRKPIQKYYYSVEGETEEWYLRWLEQLINDDSNSIFKVSIQSKIEKDPLKYAKKLNMISRTIVTHLCDYESNDTEHTTQFRGTLNSLKETSRQGKKIDYRLGYSNFTFELWITLHKADCNTSYNHRRQYLDPINRGFNEKFTELAQYKRESDFKRILRKISLSDVKDAVKRAKIIMQRNKQNGLVPHEYKGFHYYADNPSLTIGDSIESILKDCKLL
ncbi:RloB domain-containing protein [Cohnella fermenti]|nr:RloB domain-containing protein [Cohnella fermenti]